MILNVSDSAISPPRQSIVSLVESILAEPRLAGEVVHHEKLPASPAKFGAVELAAPLRRALASRGIDRLWSHQAAAIAAVERAQDVLVTTPTASGKSLIFQLPVLSEAVAGGAGRALFLFPLKALGQDQKVKFDELRQAAGLTEEQAGCEIYDGDTKAKRRTEIRRRPPRVVVTNPDMLHLGLLAHADSWWPFFSQLRFLVLDELHTYRGVFGSHFHHVLQRLFRICRAAGSNPRVIASSATAAGAGEFATALVDRPFRHLEQSGAPRAERHFLLLKPRRSPYTSTLELLVMLLRAGLKTIVFTKARRITELLYTWLREQQPKLARRVSSYRSGFLAGERRRIERRLATGRLDGVISTSALEMGIDIGGLDACLLVGYPGSVMATWQRSGRAGRQDRPSLTVLVALPDALDQYFLEHPRQLLQRPCECLVVDPDNEQVSRLHLLCAAAERPLDCTVDADYLARHAPAAGGLLIDGELLEGERGAELFAAASRPHRHVQLRGGGGSFHIVDAASGRRVGTVGGSRALHECHPGAIYLHAGRQYLVRELDLEARRARVERVSEDYFTSPLTEKETEILEVLERREDGLLHAWLVRLEVTEKVVGWERKRLHGQQVLDRHPLQLPESTFETVGLVWAAPRPLEEELRRAGHPLLGSLHAVEHASIALMPSLVLADRNDIGGISFPFHPQVGCGAVFIYDGHPGGIGLSRRAFDDLPELLRRVGSLLASCECEAGCPSCVQSPKCGNGNRPLDKRGALAALRMLLGELPLALPAARPDWVSVAPAEEVRGGRASRRVARMQVTGKPLVAGGEGAVEQASVPAPPAARQHQRQVLNTALFDLETLRSAADVGGWGNCHRMGVAVGVVLQLEEGRFEVYYEDDVESLVQSLAAADLVVGFNVERFDYRVLKGYTGVDYGRQWPTLDLCSDIHRRLGRRIGLGHLVQATLGLTKSADGLQSLEWVQQGRFDLVEAYCRRDVEVMRDLFLFGRREGYVCYLDRGSGHKVRLPVDW